MKIQVQRMYRFETDRPLKAFVDIVVEDALLGSQVARWDVTAGKWLMFPDFLAGRGSASILRDDPRNLFIESASYQAPWFLTLGGAKVGKLAQLLAKQGLGGI